MATKPQIPDETLVDPKEKDKLERSVLGRDQAPTVGQMTPDSSAWQSMRDELGPPFDAERITLKQMRQLRKDPMIAFGLHYRKVPIAQAEWTIKARDKNGNNPQVAAFIDSAIRKIYAAYIFQRMMALDFGYQAMVKRFVIANPGGVYVDYLEDNPENRVKPVWDEGSVQPRIYRTPVALRPERVAPVFDEKTGEFAGMTYDVPPAQRGKSQGFRASKGKGNQGQLQIDVYHSLWASFQKHEEHGSIYGYPLTGFARDYWWDYNFYRGLSRRAYERFAIPPVLAKHPPGSTVVDEFGNTRPNWEIALEMAERLRGNAVAAVPSTLAEGDMGDSSNQPAWDFKFMDVPTEALSVFDNKFNYLNIMKLRSVWVPEMAFLGNESGNSGGNIAEQMQIVFNASQKLLMDEVLMEINLYMIPQLLMLNFPEFVANGGTAEMVSHGFRKDDMELYKQIIQLIGQADATALSRIDVAQLLERTGLPLKDPAVFEKEQQDLANQLATQGPPEVPGVTIRNPNVNPGATNGGSQPEPAGADSAMGFADLGQSEYVYFQASGSPIDLSIELSEVDDFLANLPDSKQYNDKTMRALAVQLRRLWAAHFRRLYADLGKHVRKTKMEFEDDGKTLVFSENGMEFADPKKVAAALGVAYVTKKQAEKAARAVINDFKLAGTVYSELAKRSAVIMRKMLKRAAFLDAKDANLKVELPEDAFDSFLEEQTGRLIKFTHKTLETEVRDWLVDEIRSGRNSREIADKLVEHFEGHPKSKADRVARSETRDTANAASLIVAENTDVKYVKAEDGEEFDPECADRNGKLLTVKEAWRELRNEHPYGTLGFRLLPRAEFSVEYVTEMPDGMDDRFAYFDDASSTAYILRSAAQNGTANAVDSFLSATADYIIKHPTPKVTNGR